MAHSPAKFVIDENGNRTGVLLDMETYRQMLDAQEELDDIRAYDEAKASGADAIPLKQALAELDDPL